MAKSYFDLLIAYCNTLSNLGSGSAPKSYRKLPLLSPPPPHLWALPVDSGYTHPPPPYRPCNNKPSLNLLWRCISLGLVSGSLRYCFGDVHEHSFCTVCTNKRHNHQRQHSLLQITWVSRLYTSFLSERNFFGHLEQNAVFNPRLTTPLIPRPP